VRTHAYRIVDADIAGLNPDVVLEAVLAAALGSGEGTTPRRAEGAPMRLELNHDPEAAEQIRGLQERDGYVSDISLALRYRPDLFGKPFSELLQEVMKGPSGMDGGGTGALCRLRVGPQSVSLLNGSPRRGRVVRLR